MKKRAKVGARLGTATVIGEKSLALPDRVKARRRARRAPRPADPGERRRLASLLREPSEPAFIDGDEVLTTGDVLSLCEVALTFEDNRRARRLAKLLEQAIEMLSYAPHEADLLVEFAVDLPMRSNVDGQGGRGWWDRHALVRKQRRVVAVEFLPHTSKLRELGARGPYLTICLTRIAADAGDEDNATSAMKGIRDAVAKVLGLDDGDARLAFLPVQQEVVEGLEQTRARVEIWSGHQVCRVCRQDVIPGR